MKHGKLLFLIPIPIIIAVFVILVQPKESLIRETMRFYSGTSEDVRGYPDDTDFGAISYEYIDVDVDLKIQRNVFSAYVEGTMEIDGETYYVTNLNCTDDPKMGGIYASAHKSRMDFSHLRISDDLEFIELSIAEGDGGRYWFNCATLGEFRKGVKALYPYLELDL